MKDKDYKQVILDLRKSLAWLDLALATLNEGVIVLDSDMQILFANDAIATMLEKPRVLLLGVSVVEMIHLHKGPTRVLLKDYLGKEGESAVKLFSGAYNLKTSSNTINVELSAAHIANSKQTVLVIRDITERLQAQAQRVRVVEAQAARKAAEVSEKRMLMQYEVASVLAGSLPFEKAITRILAAVCKNLEWQAGIMWTLDKKTQNLRLLSFWTSDLEITGDFINESKERVFSKGVGLPGRVWSTGKPIWENDLTKASNFLRLQVAKDSGLNSAFAVPLYNNHDFIGVMEIYSFSAQKPDLELLTTMTTVGMQIGEYTRRKSIEKLTVSLREQRARLLEVNRAKDEFISVASHQLRTPATGVKQFLGMLVEGYGGELSDTQNILAKKAYDSNERQIAIVNDLLQVAQVDAGKVKLKKEKILLERLILNVLDEQSFKFNERNQKVSYRNDIGKLQIRVDVKNYRMAVENIIDNASKYTDTNKNIEIRTYKSGNNVITSVKDCGVGIAQNDLGKMFDKFTRIENPLSTKVGGSGLGLYWCKKIIELHGGKVNVTSTVGEGSTFSISVPID